MLKERIVRKMMQEGVTIGNIAEDLGMSKRSVKQMMKLNETEEKQKDRDTRDLVYLLEFEQQVDELRKLMKSAPTSVTMKDIITVFKKRG